VHRHVRRIGDEVAFGVEDRTGKIQPLLDVDRIAGVGERHAHLLGDRHEEVVEHFEQHRVGRGADRVRALLRLRAFEHEMIERRHQRAPFGFDHGGGDRLLDDGGADDDVARPQRVAVVDGRRAKRIIHVGAHGGARHEAAGALRERRRRLVRRLRAPDGLGADGLHHQRAPRHQEAVALTVGRLEGGDQRCLSRRLSHRQLDRGVGAVVLERDGLHHPHLRRRQALCLDVGTRDATKRGEFGTEGHQQLVAERLFDRRLPQRAHIRQSHAVGRQHAGEGVDVDALHAERVGDEAGVLATGATEAGERVFGDVVATLHTDVLDGIGHVFHGDAQEAGSDFFG